VPERGEPADLTALRETVRAELASRLSPRTPRAGFTVLGAGNDDLEAGRRYLAAMDGGGWLVPTWPLEHGGRGSSSDEAGIIAEELRLFEAPDLYPFMVGLGLVGPALLVHGTAEQQRRWLPPLRRGEEIWCQLFSEPDAGSDLASLSSRAVADGDQWRVSGTKVWSSRAHYAQWGLLLARTDPTVPKHAGITAFGLDMTARGVEVRPLRQMNGDRHFNEVFLTDVPIGDSDRIGPVGDGWKVAITTLMHERGTLGGGPGASRRELLELARGRLAGDDPVTRQRLARVISGLEVGRMTAGRARAAAQDGRPVGPEGSGAKLRSTMVLKDLAGLAIDLLGPAGLIESPGEGTDWQTLFLTGPSLSIRGGTDEIQRNILGERVLGLPPEPRIDKGPPGRTPLS
jgi:alkylation response protein AidB-like acyl-CoA dehydrogenase